MRKADRLNIDKDKSEFIRTLTKPENDYLKFSENKETFLYAASIGKRNPTEFESSDGYVLSKYINSMDWTILYALAYSKLKNLEDLNDENKVFLAVQEMPNTGYTMMKREDENKNKDNLELELLLDLNDKYDELKANGYL